MRLPTRAPEAVRRVRGVLAWAPLDDGFLAGTRTHLVHVPAAGPPVPLAWAQVEAADWSQDEEVLTVVEVGSPERRTFRLTEGSRLLQLIRERVQASILLQRHHALRGSRGFRVVARRGPDEALTWLVEYDDGIDPDAPATRRAVDRAVAAARADVGAAPI